MHSMLPSLMALIAEGGGVLVGIVLVYLLHIRNKRVIGMLFGMTSGVMIAMICFDVLPEAMNKGDAITLVLGVGIGVLLGMLLEETTLLYQKKTQHHLKKNTSIGIVLLLGIALHNIPEGFALGAATFGNIERLQQFGGVIFLHSIPEAIAFAIPMKYEDKKFKELLSIPFILGGIMSGGAFLGVVMTQMNSALITLGLGVASSIILYIVCEELIPESKKEWNGRMTSVATVLGIILGMYLVA